MPLTARLPCWGDLASAEACYYGHPQIAYWSYHGFFLAAPLSRDARLCAPANQRVEMSSRQWCVQMAHAREQ
eukprot:scaffold98740_cov82-Phaeocystis_antarctica.AAC.1